MDERARRHHRAKDVHVRTCRCTPHLTCVSLSSNGSLAAHQVQTQSAQPFARYGKRVCTYARADATHPDLCKARIYWAPSHTKFERNTPSRLRDLEKGYARAHMQMHSTSDMWKALIKWVPSHTQNLNAICLAVCETWKRGVHVRTCRYTPPQTCVKRLSNG